MWGRKIRVLWFALLFSCSICAEEQEVDGYAPYDPQDVEQSRRLAVQDARQQAALQAGVEISTTSTAGHPQNDETTLRSTGVVKNARVLDEQAEGDLFHVHVAATTEPGNLPYRKKVVLTRFAVLHPSQMPDIAAIEDEYPKEIMRRLEASQRFLVNDATQYSVLEGSGPGSLERENREVVHRVAFQNNAQLVIAGTIVDAGSTPSTDVRSSVMGDWIPSLKKDVRRIEVDLYLYDGVNGNLISSQRYTATARGRVEMDRGVPFASRQFFHTDFGTAIEKVMAAQVQDLIKTMGCLPFMARVVRTEGETVFIDAGATSLVRPQDVLSVSRRESISPLLDMDGTTTLGHVEKYAGTVTIVQVQPLFSVAHLDRKGTRLTTGDYVLFRGSDE